MGNLTVIISFQDRFWQKSMPKPSASPGRGRNCCGRLLVFTFAGRNKGTGYLLWGELSKSGNLIETDVAKGNSKCS